MNIFELLAFIFSFSSLIAFLVVIWIIGYSDLKNKENLEKKKVAAIIKIAETLETIQND